MLRSVDNYKLSHQYFDNKFNFIRDYHSRGQSGPESNGNEEMTPHFPGLHH